MKEKPLHSHYGFAKLDAAPAWVLNNLDLVAAWALNRSVTTMKMVARKRLDGELAKSLTTWSLKTWLTRPESRKNKWRKEFARSQNVLAAIINKAVVRAGGMFYNAEETKEE